MVKALVGMEFGVHIMENSVEFHKYRTTICPRKNVSGKIIRITFKEIIKKSSPSQMQSPQRGELSWPLPTHLPFFATRTDLCHHSGSPEEREVV